MRKTGAWRPVAVLVVATWLAACGSFGTHLVRKGETLYSISWRYGLDYRTLARWNGISPPYVIHEGQRLRLGPPATGKGPEVIPAPASGGDGTSSRRSPSSSSSADRGNQAPAARREQAQRHAPPRHLRWRWPARGRLVGRFVAGDTRRKGIDIAGRAGDPVRAAADGRVVYSGSGIPRYGNLLIVKHNARYLSAYAHNRRLLVKEGEVVKAGQAIAEMGRTGTGIEQVMLHFEIRADGVPVDPLRYLPRR
ncbi:MAG TPA: LysM peptidoglycan-binding domain-containing protein [Gammaproteobacteria bacterium]|nr:LysM peptidoglycan-binding domain-containing protein [Gammaproteobacteria bacterium]